ncbi:hypothetical protein [Cellulophaga lytica]|uniref:Uncharacterized protein n=1 Tax=Cellulophaga lytica (strain ATCC 23178 / DSM 7489 / JCM 8516 / NBRC 14961 / NCIMB 1423 / VKM B-1433 / Cy l20) TaxID=867900 RepID=F0RE36_CELLC|nr:hypothetical protein [Cellulophaga lytica]ADY28798.1 hypothetical protein Celly_0968 [Cellulophaga lytica DSM 7489]AIM59845.1 hypothetical protein IX49_04665 [Cellulophaga lytica]WQG77023.1 hypothetical protein SR888_15180 [Cellulophaga lytica]
MQKTDEYIAKRLKWKAGKHSLPTQHSFLFESLPSENQKFYSELFKSQNIGIPVLVFTQPTNDKWTVFGTRKIVWGEYNNFESLLISDIKEMRPQSLVEISENEKVTREQVKKAEWDELTITNLNSEQFVIPAFKGSDFFAMWNILLMNWQLNRKLKLEN